MLVRRAICAAAAAATLSIATAGVVGAQESPPTSAILPSSEVQDTTAPGALPATGSDVMPTVLLGAGFAGAGVVLVAATRRKRSAAAVVAA